MGKVMIRNRWVFIIIMFSFLFFHQLTGFVVERIPAQLSTLENFSDQWFNIQLPLESIVALLFFLIWGFLFDTHSRKKLLSLAGFLWGVSSWLMGIAPTFATFNLSRAASGINRASESGIFALVGDLFKPNNRGKILGLLLLAQPLAFAFGTILPDFLLAAISWRVILLILGAIALMFALIIHVFFQEPKRGAREPALMGVQITGTYQFDWGIAKVSLKKPGLLMVYACVFFGTIPWFVIQDGLWIYLNTIQNLEAGDIYVILLPTLLGITLGYPLGGILGDILFRYRRNGRIYVFLLGLVMPSFCLNFAFRSTNVLQSMFSLCLMGMGFFMAFTWPNLIASVLDITLPELRASAIAIIFLLRAIGIIISPRILSMLGAQVGIQDALMWICIGSWGVCLIFCYGLLFFIPQEMEQLRRHMAYRSHLEARLAQTTTR